MFVFKHVLMYVKRHMLFSIKCINIPSPLPNIGGFHAISGDTNNNGEINKFWWTNKES